MTTGGWIIMLLSLSVIIGGFSWCLWRVLCSSKGNIRSPADIHPDEYDHQAPGPRQQE